MTSSTSSSRLASPLISVIKAVPRHPDFPVAAPVDFEMNEGEIIAICGENGAGKTLLVNIITGALPLREGSVKYNIPLKDGEHFYDQLRVMAFHDAFGDLTPEYHQQRWNHGDEKTYPTVGEVLNADIEGLKDLADRNDAKSFLKWLCNTSELEKPINWLSSGELRKFQIAKEMRHVPRVLIIDSPFIGLDAQTREQFCEVLATLARTTGLILVMARDEDIPEFVTHVVRVDGRRVGSKVRRCDYIADVAANVSHLSEAERNLVRDLAARTPAPDVDSLLKFNDITISYFGRTILSHVSWEVLRGERWALKGPNGSGKSTLLSLVCADNPMAYACDITLFGHRRGTGESIWDIKRHIGYVSPELYRSYCKPERVIDIVGSGLRDTNGLHRLPDDSEKAYCRQWLDLFELTNLADRSFLKISEGEQRLVLLARAFVKSPSLIILDEPFHGLDSRRRQRALEIIETYVENRDKSIIMVSHYDVDFPEIIDKNLTLSKQKDYD